MRDIDDPATFARTLCAEACSVLDDDAGRTMPPYQRAKVLALTAQAAGLAAVAAAITAGTPELGIDIAKVADALLRSHR